MATVATTNTRCKVERQVAGASDSWTFGPSDFMPGNSVLITSDALAQIGAPPVVYSEYVYLKIYVYDTVSGVATARDFSGGDDPITTAFTLWDPVSKVAVLTGSGGAYDGYVLINYDPGEITQPDPGMYQFNIVQSLLGSKTTVCSGWLEIMPATPSA